MDDRMLDFPVELDVRVTGYKEYRPKGDLLPNGKTVKREQVVVFTDPGGCRTLPLRNIIKVR